MTPTIPKGMKPFDVNEAMQDVTKVRTREGKTIRQMFVADKIDDTCKLIVVNIRGSIKTYRIDGTKNDSLYDDADLFLIDNEPEEDEEKDQIGIAEEIQDMFERGKDWCDVLELFEITRR